MGSYLIRGAHLLTRDGDGDDLVIGDLRIDGQWITDIGSGLSSEDAEVIDAAGMIAMPGLIDTHRHCWGSILRGGACHGDLSAYFATNVFTYGAAFTPEDNYTSVRFGMAEAVDSGITGVHAWEHNIQTPQHARASLQALRESGMRGRFSYGPSADPESPRSFAVGTEPIDFDDILRFRDEEFSQPGRFDLGIAARGVEFSREDVWKAEFAFARQHGLPITAHSMMTPHDIEEHRSVQIYQENGALGPDLQLVHCIRVNEEEIGWLAESGTHVSISILSNLRCGMGLPPVLAMTRAGVAVALSMDTMGASDNSDMFAAMRVTLGIERAKADDGSAFQPAEVLHQATAAGAAYLGLGEETGVLRKGALADLILLRATDLNMAPLNVPEGQVVLCAQPANVDTVFIDGALRKRNRELIGLDRRQLVTEATATMDALKARVGVPVA
ncbi:MAG: amidohydrolase family protein [Solirubrobacteraceae bacterium]